METPILISARAKRFFLCISILLLLSSCRREIPLEPTDDTNPPASPTLTLDDTSATGTYTVHWTAPTGATSYVLHEDERAGFDSAVVAYAGSDTSVQITGKPSGKTYFYRVIAENRAGKSVWSETKSIVIL